MFRQKVTLFFLLVLIGNYASGGGGPSTKFYCWHVLTYFYKKIFRRELVISFCPVGTSIFSIMATLGGWEWVGWTSLCKTGWWREECGQLDGEMRARPDDPLLYAVYIIPRIRHKLNGCCPARPRLDDISRAAPLNWSANILRTNSSSVGFSAHTMIHHLNL